MTETNDAWVERLAKVPGKLEEVRANVEHVIANPASTPEATGAARAELLRLADEIAPEALAAKDHSAFRRTRPFTASSVLHETLPDRRYLLTKGVEGVIMRGEVGLLVAAGGVGKSWLLTHLGACIATGRPWLELFTPNSEGGKVLLVLAEEKTVEAKRRVQSLARRLGMVGERDPKLDFDGTNPNAERALDNLHVWGMAGEDVGLTRETEGGELELTQAHKDLVEYLETNGPFALVAIDPLSRFAPADAEKDNHAATRFIQAVERLTMVSGNPTVLVAHHSSKNARKEGTGAAGVASRGVSGLTDGARWVAELTRSEALDGCPVLVDFAVTKSNYTAHTRATLVQRPEAKGMLELAAPHEVKAYMDTVKAKKIAQAADATEAREVGRTEGKSRANGGGGAGKKNSHAPAVVEEPEPNPEDY